MQSTGGGCKNGLLRGQCDGEHRLTVRQPAGGCRVFEAALRVHSRSPLSSSRAPLSRGVLLASFSTKKQAKGRNRAAGSKRAATKKYDRGPLGGAASTRSPLLCLVLSLIRVCLHDAGAATPWRRERRGRPLDAARRIHTWYWIISRAFLLQFIFRRTIADSKRVGRSYVPRTGGGLCGGRCTGAPCVS